MGNTLKVHSKIRIHYSQLKLLHFAMACENAVSHSGRVGTISLSECIRRPLLVSVDFYGTPLRCWNYGWIKLTKPLPQRLVVVAECMILFYSTNSICWKIYCRFSTDIVRTWLQLNCLECLRCMLRLYKALCNGNKILDPLSWLSLFIWQPKWTL